MTSLNPLLSVGYQITEVIKQHHSKSFSDAKKEAIELMEKVGIPNAEKRFKDIPGKYSGGMRQRIVIAIALASLPQLGQKGEELFSIAGTPPSLFNEIKGDAFAPRNEFALAIDYEVAPPMFEFQKHMVLELIT
ncbi:hypothetical protein FQA39_LY13010 [Lamprigera yunnana]|nr:hypothetical protein FQA39_LY13010 [Lamprigera yunnana]